MGRVKKEKMQEKVLVRFRAWWKTNGEDQAIFDTEEEAKEWIDRLGDPSGVIEVKRIPSVIVKKPQYTGFLVAKNVEYFIVDGDGKNG